MSTAKIAITIDESILGRLDRLVRSRNYPNRSKVIQRAIEEKLARLDRTRLAQECAKLDPDDEQKLAEEGVALEIEEWPQY